jgi:hypothetical protein
MEVRQLEQVDVEDHLILVEFVQRPGVQQVAFTSDELVQRSGAALNDAMRVIQQMGDKLQKTVAAMAQRPQEVQVSFGLKFDAEAGAFIARTGVEASVNVTLSWTGEPGHA